LHDAPFLNGYSSGSTIEEGSRSVKCSDLKDAGGNDLPVKKERFSATG